MLKQSLVNTGDMLAFKDKGFIGFFSAGYGHIAIVSEIEPSGTIHIIEAHLDTQNDKGEKVSGVLEKTLNEKWYSDIEVYRVKGGLNLQQQLKLIAGLRKDYVGKTKYNLASFPMLWFYSTILKPIGLGNLAPEHKKHSEVCSTLPHEAYKKYLNIDVLPELAEDVGTPGDYPHSSALFKVC